MSDTTTPEANAMYDAGWADGINGLENAHPDDKDYVEGYDAGETFIEEEDDDEVDL